MQIPGWARSIPLLSWAWDYDRSRLREDVIAGIVVTFLTIPQAIAYAFLAGLPAEAGLYAAIAALVCYAVFGSSRTLAVGPTAIVAMMCLEIVSALAPAGTTAYADTAVQLALVTGLVLIFLRMINFGALVSFLSHAVVTGFVSAAACLIIVSQFPAIAGIEAAPAPGIGVILFHLGAYVNYLDPVTLSISLSAMLLMWFCRSPLSKIVEHLSLSPKFSNALSRSAPMYAVLLGILLVWGFSLGEVAVVGDIPTHLPSLRLRLFDLEQMLQLLPSAVLISMVIFIESTSVGTAVAAKRREKIEPNRELVALGGANVGAALLGGFPVAGSFARTIVNFGSGATSPMASLITALGVIVVVAWLAPLFYYVPQCVLAAVIVMSALQLIDVPLILKIVRFNQTDAVTFLCTFVAVLATGVETGILIGIAISFALVIRASSKPNIAVVGRVGQSEHFRNVSRHAVMTSPHVLAVRIDESLYFVNTRYIETFLLSRVAESPALQHVLLICTATNFIDTSGLEMLETLSGNLDAAGVTLHLAEVKGPVMDRLTQTDYYRQMRGQVFFTADIAMRELGGI
jgi:SulP family sulfate permease|tara:strand:+ start:662 stop:2377 length:1716 start_codon:yes stop_codon:yes gene_type:complete